MQSEIKKKESMVQGEILETVHVGQHDIVKLKETLFTVIFCVDSETVETFDFETLQEARSFIENKEKERH